MKEIIRPLVPKFIMNSWRKRKKQKQLEEWKKNGCPVPPPHIVKQMTIAEYGKSPKHSILVETGTFMGDMMEAQKKNFDTLYSIELSEDLFKKATIRFEKDKHITIVQGDSGKVLPDVMKNIKAPAVFWLDGHYSAGITARGDKDCPIYEEVDAIFKNTQFDHILLVDDARCFTGEGDYPTIDELTDYVQTKNKNYKVEVKHDIIRYVV